MSWLKVVTRPSANSSKSCSASQNPYINPCIRAPNVTDSKQGCETYYPLSLDLYLLRRLTRAMLWQSLLNFYLSRWFTRAMSLLVLVHVACALKKRAFAFQPFALIFSRNGLVQSSRLESVAVVCFQ